MGNELKIGTWEKHKCNMMRSNYELNYPNDGGISSKEWHSCWVYGPCLFSLPTKGRPTQASNREINQKLLSLLEQPSCLTASHGELENRVFPWVFAHHEPIRRCRLRSRDSCVGFQQSDVRASQWWQWPLSLMYFHL